MKKITIITTRESTGENNEREERILKKHHRDGSEKRERREKHQDKERKRNRDEVSTEEEGEYRYNRHRNAPGFRHGGPPLHGEHERWLGGGMPRERFPGDHSNRQFNDYLRGGGAGYHRERDYIRTDKRSPEGKTDWRQYPRDARGMVPPNMPPRALFYGGNFPGSVPPMYPQEGRFPSGEWRPPDRDYYRRSQ